MKKYIINGVNKSEILLGESFNNIKKYIPKSKVIILTDSNVYKIYKSALSNYNIIEIKAGEDSKSIDVIENIIKKLLNYNADRNSFLLGVGGGVICDITGFVASIFMRGITFGFVPTTLLAQVDASVGGKNGVNFLGIKNLIGTFNQPKFIICDTSFLQTLPEKEIKCGLGEIIKHSIIYGNDFFNFLDKNKDEILQNNNSINHELINKSIKLKSRIVSDDEFDKNSRKILNLGHTIAHALEMQTGISHGEAVSRGIIFAVDFSIENKYITDNKAIKIKNLISDLNLIPNILVDKDLLIKSIFADKKKNNYTIDFVFIESIGKVFIKNIEISILSEFIKNYNFS